MTRYLLVVSCLLLFACGGKPTPDVPQPPPAPTTTAAKPDAEAPADPNKTRLAAASLRLSEGRQAFDEGDFAKATFKAQAGLDTLGKDYASPAIEDDTELKIQAAKERMEAGGTKDGLLIMLRMLEARIEMARKHWKLTQ